MPVLISLAVVDIMDAIARWAAGMMMLKTNVKGKSECLA
jgi:hypothetical protein